MTAAGIGHMPIHMSRHISILAHVYTCLNACLNACPVSDVSESVLECGKVLLLDAMAKLFLGSSKDILSVFQGFFLGCSKAFLGCSKVFFKVFQGYFGVFQGLF